MIRPAGPLPGTWRRSTPASLVRSRTAGEASGRSPSGRGAPAALAKNRARGCSRRRGGFHSRSGARWRLGPFRQGGGFSRIDPSGRDLYGRLSSCHLEPHQRSADAHPVADLGAEPSREQAEFFEKKVRPILVERCHGCHSEEGKIKGGLLLDSREGLLEGGEGGTVVLPGKPEESRLVEAIHYKNEKFRMPPKERLPDAEIEILTRWVKLGKLAATGTRPTAAGLLIMPSRRMRERTSSTRPTVPSSRYTSR